MGHCRFWGFDRGRWWISSNLSLWFELIIFGCAAESGNIGMVGWLFRGVVRIFIWLMGHCYLGCGMELVGRVRKEGGTGLYGRVTVS